jgi:hypothetical protein
MIKYPNLERQFSTEEDFNILNKLGLPSNKVKMLSHICAFRSFGIELT